VETADASSDGPAAPRERRSLNDPVTRAPALASLFMQGERWRRLEEDEGGLLATDRRVGGQAVASQMCATGARPLQPPRRAFPRGTATEQGAAAPRSRPSACCRDAPPKKAEAGAYAPFWLPYYTIVQLRDDIKVRRSVVLHLHLTKKKTIGGFQLIQNTN
jgi:hypothetical protein